MSMTGISNSYNNYVTQNTNDTTKKNVAKSNSRQVEFKEFNSEITRLMAIPFWLFMYQELNVSRSLFILITIYLVAAIVEIGKATIIAQR